MNIEIGDVVDLSFNDGTTAKVELVDIKTYSMMPADYWFEYLPEETNRQLVHPDFGTNSFIKASVLLPEGLLPYAIKTAGSGSKKEQTTFEARLEAYIEKSFNPEDQAEGRSLMNRLLKISGEQYIIDNHFNK